MDKRSIFQKKISIPLWFLLLLCLFTYWVWEIYWYREVGLNFIKWHTHFMFLISIWYFASLGIFLLRGRKEAQLGLATFFTSLILAELGMMLLGFNKTYTEKRNGIYQSILNEHHRNYLRNYDSDSSHQLISPEFTYERKTNRDGFSDVTFEDKGSNILIQTYGDSFTEGDGAPADSSYPSNLRRLLGKGYVVQNYGICGNDPEFYLKQFEKIGILYEPDVIVLSYGTGDFVVDFFSRGGLERYTQDEIGKHKAPWWETVYAISYVSRLFFHAAGLHYNSFFMKESDRIARLKSLERKWNILFAEIARMAELYQTKVLLFKKPERSEIVSNRYEYDMSFFDQFLKNKPIFHHVDLLPFYRSQGLIDSKSTAPYYWPKDGHHNSKGYAILAKGVYLSVQDLLMKN